MGGYPSLLSLATTYFIQVTLTPENVKYKFQEKYPQKLLVYLAISPKGVSKPFFVPSGLAVNQKVYLESCVKKVLEPFIQKHYKQGKYVFWPDLADLCLYCPRLS